MFEDTIQRATSPEDSPPVRKGKPRLRHMLCEAIAQKDRFQLGGLLRRIEYVVTFHLKYYLQIYESQIFQTLFTPDAWRVLQEELGKLGCWQYADFDSFFSYLNGCYESQCEGRFFIAMAAALMMLVDQESIVDGLCAYIDGSPLIGDLYYEILCCDPEEVIWI